MAPSGNIIQIPRIADPRGNLSFVQTGPACPFPIERVYWLYDVPGGSVRHGRALRCTHEMIIALAGAFDVHTTDIYGNRTTVHLDRCWHGLHLPPGTWREIDNFTSGAIALVLASGTYSASDYVEDFQQYLKMRPGQAIADKRPAALPATTDPHATSTLADVRMVKLPKHIHPNGSITVVENTPEAIFDVRRAFYLYDVPADSSRGGHSHLMGRELIIAVSGAFDVSLDDGMDKRVWTLNRPYQALYVPTGLWRELGNFSGGAVCLVLSSTQYDEADYVRDYSDFLNRTASKRK